MTDTAAINQAIDCLETACQDIGEAMNKLGADSGSRLGEAQSIVRSVMFDLDNQTVERSGLIEQMQEYRSNG